MKKLLFILCIPVMLFMTACKKSFLDANPQGQLTQSQLTNNKAGIDGLVNAGYQGLSTHFSGQWPDFFHPPSNWSFGDVRSDDAYKGGGGTGDILEYNELETCNITADNAMLYDKWKADFTGISNINTAIQALNSVSTSVYPNRDIRIAEMETLHAYFYLDLIKHFYAVPWIDYTVSTASLAKVPNNLSQQQLYDNVEKELLAAVNVLPATQSDVSRVNKYGALGFLTKLYMFEKNYVKASATADQIINSGKYGLMPTFEQLYSQPQFEHGPEFIFSIAFSADPPDTENLNFGDLLNAPSGAPYGGGDGFDRPSQNLVNAFKVDANGLPFLDTFNQSDLAPRDVTTAVDPRLDWAIGRPGMPWKDWTGGVQQDAWARTEDVYGPYLKKKNIIDVNSPYREGTGFPWALGALDFPLIKYSQVLLWKAECDVETGSNLDEARTLINQIRTRAKNAPYVQNLSGGNAANYQIGLYPSTNWTQDYARKAVRFESRLELCLEGQRFYDLVRWGVADQVINNFYQTESTKHTFLSGATFIKGKHEYLPVPQSEIDRAQGVYQQNPFYK
ncbi:MAG: RagB/SusD family nutrient uptake outer membrane protein [Mucilaginibacter sp.]